MPELRNSKRPEAVVTIVNRKGLHARASAKFVKLAESFGLPAWRCESADDFGQRLQHALTLDVPSLIVLPIDYSLDVAISEELGAETVAT